MAFAQTAAPAVEPISLSEAKAFLRVEHNADDAFIQSLIATSRLQVEAALDLALIDQAWRWRGELAGGSAIELRPRRVSVVNGVNVVADDQSTAALGAGDYVVDLDVQPATVCIKAVGAKRIEIEFRAGFGVTAAEVPAPIRQALLQLVAHWHENREPIAIGDTAERIPITVSDLLAPYREVRL